MPSSFAIGLTDSSIRALMNGQSIKLNTKDMGFPEVPITLYYGGSDEDIKRPNPELSQQRVLTRKETE